MQNYFGFRVAILFKAKNETIMGGCSLLHGTAFLSWQGTRGDNCPPIGRSAELGMLWIAVEEYDERNIQVVRYAPCIQITPPNKDAAFESHIRGKMCGDHALYSQEARQADISAGHCKSGRTSCRHLPYAWPALGPDECPWFLHPLCGTA